ncbi:MAG: sarcosine oxidase subunit delta [Candidatus Competibacteraceae bacterium]|nr:sarcosine oxidase subunit delta [Candidatus Competibacteraceae bacterium]
MHQISCPWCGVRDEAEFQYQGDASLGPPPLSEELEAACRAVYFRANPRGWHLEWWHHVAGCRQYVKVLRHTVSHQIAATGWPGDHLEPPL